MSKRLSGIAVLACTLVLGSCGDDGAGPNSREVRMLAASFSPNDVTISAGESVTWVNDQAIAHTITPSNAQQPGAWTSISVPATTGFATAVRFNTAGVFNYFCSLHVGMTVRNSSLRG